MLRSVLCAAAAAALMLVPLDRVRAETTQWPAPGSRVHLHAHNCYPDRGHWSDRLDRALASGAAHLAIEQDLVWQPAAGGRQGRSVVGHDAPARGDEPALEDHFFRRVSPLMEAALAERQVERWPILVLHLDFKTNEPEHHRFIWELLGRYERWLTTAERTGDGPMSPLAPGPLLVLTESGPGQEQAFNLSQPAGSRLRLFGTVPPDAATLPQPPQARAEAVARVPPEVLIPSGATSYRRWTNHSWATVESGGPNGAGEWTTADAERLRSIVQRAHGNGLWVRFYGLNGHDTTGDGWSPIYNFGSRARVEARWRAAIDAGVEFIASDQYEGLADVLAAPAPKLP